MCGYIYNILRCYVYQYILVCLVCVRECGLSFSLSVHSSSSRANIDQWCNIWTKQKKKKKQYCLFYFFIFCMCICDTTTSCHQTKIDNDNNKIIKSFYFQVCFFFIFAVVLSTAEKKQQCIDCKQDLRIFRMRKHKTKIF